MYILLMTLVLHFWQFKHFEIYIQQNNNNLQKLHVHCLSVCPSVCLCFTSYMECSTKIHLGMVSDNILAANVATDPFSYFFSWLNENILQNQKFLYFYILAWVCYENTCDLRLENYDCKFNSLSLVTWPWSGVSSLIMHAQPFKARTLVFCVYLSTWNHKYI